MVASVEVEERGAFTQAGGEDFAEEDGVVATLVDGLNAGFEGSQAVVQEGGAKRARLVRQIGQEVAGVSLEAGAPVRQLLLAQVEDVDAEDDALFQELVGAGAALD